MESAVARQQTVLGSVPLSKLSRLRDAAAEGNGVVNVSLQFGRDAERRVHVSGQLDAQLPLTCQRCLQSYDWHQTVDVDWVLVSSEAEESRLLKECEPVLIEDDTLYLQDLLQDEVLLAVPLVPRCADEDCAASSDAE